MRAKKKNRFFTFCWSMIPGAGEMYMGFMKTGISLMLMFILTIGIFTSINMGALASLCVVIWFYSFFHANHLASLSDEEFIEVKDEYVITFDSAITGKDFLHRYQKWIAMILIFVGAFMVLQVIGDMAYYFLPEAIYRAIWKTTQFVPQVAAAIAIILIGVHLIKGRTVELLEKTEIEEQNSENQQNEKENEESIWKDKQ